MSKFTEWAKIKSPEILLVGSIVMSLTSVVTGIIATTKVNKRIIEPAKPKAIELKAKVEELESTPDTPKDVLVLARRERNKYYLKVGAKVGLYYAPTVLAFILSTAATIGSHNIMRGRNIALAAAFTALKSSYDTYRDKVRAKLGDEVEKALAADCDKKTVTVKNEKGKEVQKEIIVPKDNSDDIYNTYWGPGNYTYDSSLGKEANLHHLYHTEQYLNDKLRAKGVVYLSEVYEELGIPDRWLSGDNIKASRIVGWIFDPSSPDSDSVIDFGLRDHNGNVTQNVKDFLVNREEYLKLNLNHDGDIITKDEKVAKLLNIYKKG